MRRYSLGAHTLVVVDYVSKMVSTAVMSLAHAHGVVRKVHVAIIA